MELSNGVTGGDNVMDCLCLACSKLSVFNLSYFMPSLECTFTYALNFSLSDTHLEASSAGH